VVRFQFIHWNVGATGNVKLVSGMESNPRSRVFDDAVQGRVIRWTLI